MADQLATFAVGDGLYGIEVTGVQEVLTYRGATRVPLAPAEVSGLVNLRGQVVLALDLRARLGLPPFELDTERMMVVVRREEEPIALIVDRIGEVADVRSEQFETPPQTLDPTLRSVITGAYKLDGHLLMALDVEAVVGK